MTPGVIGPGFLRESPDAPHPDPYPKPGRCLTASGLELHENHGWPLPLLCREQETGVCKSAQPKDPKVPPGPESSDLRSEESLTWVWTATVTTVSIWVMAGLRKIPVYWFSNDETMKNSI